MILKETKLNVADNCGVLLVKCFHIYQNKKKRHGHVGKFIKVSYRQVIKKLNRLIGKKSRAFYCKSKYKYTKPDGSIIFFYENICTLLKKRLYPRGKISKGVIVYNLKRYKFMHSFKFII